MGRMRSPALQHCVPNENDLPTESHEYQMEYKKKAIHRLERIQRLHCFSYADAAAEIDRQIYMNGDATSFITLPPVSLQRPIHPATK